MIQNHLLWLLLAGSLSCAAPPPRSAATPKNAGQSESSARSGPAASTSPLASLGTHGQLGRVLLESDGNVLAFSPDTGTSAVLAHHAVAAVYDPEMELVWLTQERGLEVLDLRDAPPRTIEIANGISADRNLVISRGRQQLLKGPEICDASSLWVEWSDSPWIKDYESEHITKKFAGRDWLAHEHAQRAPRAVPQPEDLDQSPQRVQPTPAPSWSCFDDPCEGNAIAFGNTGWQLVLTGGELGDCPHRSCLLYDPKSQLFATPPEPKQWGLPANESDSCGPYLFNADTSAFMVADQLCTADGCRQMPGFALGWLEPGRVIGAGL